MREIRHDIYTDPSKFQLVMIPCSCYQKKDGTAPTQKDSYLSKFVEMNPNLLSEIGKGVEEYGNCPAVLSHIEGTPFPTKFATFPVTPTGLRAENPDQYVFQRLQGKFKEYSLLPGWTLVPRSDMVEFSSIKLAEIIKYYKLTKIAIPFELFTLDREDRDDYNRIRNIMEKHLGNEVFIVTKPVESQGGTVHSGMVSSTVEFED